MIDAGARVGSAASSALGRAHRGVENRSCARLRRILEGNALYAASACCSISWTWMSSYRTTDHRLRLREDCAAALHPACLCGRECRPQSGWLGPLLST
eukprot:3374331-Pyramimonas_sp.AAC.1